MRDGSFCIECDNGKYTAGAMPEDAEDENEGPETGPPDAEDKKEGMEPDEETAEKAYMKPVASLEVALSKAAQFFSGASAAKARPPASRTFGIRAGR